MSFSDLIGDLFGPGSIFNRPPKPKPTVLTPYTQSAYITGVFRAKNPNSSREWFQNADGTIKADTADGCYALIVDARSVDVSRVQYQQQFDLRAPGALIAEYVAPYDTNPNAWQVQWVPWTETWIPVSTFLRTPPVNCSITKYRFDPVTQRFHAPLVSITEGKVK